MKIEEANYEYQVGQEIGLRDVIDPTDVRWFTLIGIISDDEMPIGWFYLRSDADGENVHDGPFGPYADIVESVSERLVIR